MRLRGWSKAALSLSARDDVSDMKSTCGGTALFLRRRHEPAYLGLWRSFLGEASGLLGSRSGLNWGEVKAVWLALTVRREIPGCAIFLVRRARGDHGQKIRTS